MRYLSMCSVVFAVMATLKNINHNVNNAKKRLGRIHDMFEVNRKYVNKNYAPFAAFIVKGQTLQLVPSENK